VYIPSEELLSAMAVRESAAHMKTCIFPLRLPQTTPYANKSTTDENDKEHNKDKLSRL
jgi:hypothetical protein